MPSQLFQVNRTDLNRLHKFFKNSPGKFNWAVATMLNNFAFGTRSASMQIIHDEMLVRSPSFVASSLQVEKTRGSIPMAAQKTKMGSVRRPRFSGWVEQELGTATKRTRTIQLEARGGSKKGKVKAKARMQNTGRFRTPDDYPGSSAHGRAVTMLNILGRQGHKEPFVIKGHRRLKTGLYKFKGGGKKRKLRMLQNFRPRNAQPKRVRWLTKGRDNFFSQADVRMMWGGALRRVLKFV